MRTLTYFVAATLDGFIAGPGGEYDFLHLEDDVLQRTCAEYPETLPVHGREAYGVADAPNRRFDTVVMGRGTYDPGLQIGLTSPYPHLRQYVCSRTLAAPDPAVQIVAEDPVGLVRDLKQQPGMGIWLAGGGQLAGVLRDEIDELVIKRHPVLLGAGIPLFAGGFVPTRFTPVEEHAMKSGVTITTYAKADSRR